LSLEFGRLLVLKTLRYVVVGDDASGKSAILRDGVASDIVEPLPGMMMANLWTTPAVGEVPGSPEAEQRLEPGPGGSVLKIATFPPAAAYQKDDWSKVMEAVGGPAMDSPLHATATIDYAVVLSGEVYCVLETGEVRLTAGDVIVQCAAMHSWENRSNEPCTMVGVMIGKTV
jgi:hypothetical protein